MDSAHPEKVASASPRPGVPGCLGPGCYPGLWCSRAGDRGGGWRGSPALMCHARTGPGAEAHHHLPAGRQPSFQLVAALHPRRGQRRRQDPSPAHVSSRQSPLGVVRPVWFGLQSSAVLESTVAWPTVGLLQGLQLGKCSEPHSGVGLQWGLQELGLGVWGVTQPGGDVHLGSSPTSAHAQTWEERLLKK